MARTTRTKERLGGIGSQGILGSTQRLATPSISATETPRRSSGKDVAMSIGKRVARSLPVVGDVLDIGGLVLEGVGAAREAGAQAEADELVMQTQQQALRESRAEEDRKRRAEERRRRFAAALTR